LTGTCNHDKKSAAPFRRIQEEKMLNCLFDKIESAVIAEKKKSCIGIVRAARAAACAIAIAAWATACDTGGAPPPAPGSATTNAAASEAKPLLLQEGDTVKVSFLGAPNLDTVQTIRRDGKITLAQIGEYDAVGKTPAQVEADLKKRYSSQLVNSDCTVTVQQSAFVIYIMGAVSKPGKLTSERPLTPLEALIESGIDNQRSNLKSVWVIRTDSSGHTERFKLNLYDSVHGKSNQMPTFALKPYDILNVPERFNFY
jgi:polysaccharide biosynthesis/export protein